jgi:hypothetical protein
VVGDGLAAEVEGSVMFTQEGVVSAGAEVSTVGFLAWGG